MVVHETPELYKKTIIAAFSNPMLVCELDDVVVVGEISYFDSSTCEMDAHFHFLIHVLSGEGRVQSYAFYDPIDLAV